MRKMKMKVYYAHCVSLYGTPQEKRDIEILEKFGFEVLNPSDEGYQTGFKHWLKKHEHDTKLNKMDYWTKLAQSCDALIFRRTYQGKITSGVAKEIVAMMGVGKPILELPFAIYSSIMTLEETREYLKLIGQR